MPTGPRREARGAPGGLLSTLTTPAPATGSGVAVGLLLAFAASIAFSGKAIIVKLAYGYGVDPMTLIMYRMLLSLPLFLALSWWAGRGQEPLSRPDWIAVALLGFSGYYLGSYLDFIGLQYVTASLARLIQYLNPTLVLVLSVWLLGRRASLRQWLAIGISYVGVLLVFGQEIGLQSPHTGLGALLVFGSTVSYSLYLVYSGRVVQRIGALRLTGLATTVACLLCIAQFLLLRPLEAAWVAPPVFWLSLINATVCTFAPILMTMVAIQRLGPATTSQIGMVGPLATVAMGVAILDEPFTAWLVAGTVLVLTGIYLLTRWR